MAANRIVVKHEAVVYEEAIASGILKPGHHIKLDTDGKVLKHATAGGKDSLMVAIEDSLQGKTITDAYAVGDLVRYEMLKHGDVFYGRVPAAAPAIVIGDSLVADGTGCFIKLVTSTHHIYAEAIEALDNSAGGAEAFLKMKAMG